MPLMGETRRTPAFRMRPKWQGMYCMECARTEAVFAQSYQVRVEGRQ